MSSPRSCRETFDITAIPLFTSWMAMAHETVPVTSQTGSHWHMQWLSAGLDNLHLDVVGFLAILGEDAVKKTSRLASLSWTFCLPRLLPAPHSLLFSERAEEHDVVRAKVTQPHSGLHRDYLTHVTAAMLYVDVMKTSGKFR